VVRDSQGGKMAALSKAVEGPSQISPPAAPQTPPPAAQQIAPPGPGVTRGGQGGNTAEAGKTTEAPSQAPPTTAQQVAPSAPAVARGSRSQEMAALSRTTEAPSRTPPPPTELVAPADEPFFDAYRQSDPITNWPLKKLLHQVPELKGINPASDQSELPGILRGVSANLQKFVVTFVDTTALETVDETEKLPIGRGPERALQKYRYLMLARWEGGAFTLDEYRTDLKGQEENSRKLIKAFIKTTGFATMPLFFGPLQQPWSDFRLLGQQKIGSDLTVAVAFAEHIEPAAVMGRFLIGATSIPILLQGVAWIRTSDYQILKMRTDLLAPLPSAALKQVTTVVNFAKTQFQDNPAALWLPREVKVKGVVGRLEFSNRHRYSDYQLFRVKSVIKPG